ncbi:DUF2783 domain-containing protein [Fulvimarina endophytica]|uniref:DUF2783 domain-containing protein n=1 Tax=Fulvimarina endophytica TaxID=2293836 RepID=A0A371WZ95_9HYPH|nr:DUF2783 domain-containing protein [Fulvimarina endophytica]RFC62292.1 DUF2783 domain-containing protein [Fulvimarina endophytica]
MPELILTPNLSAHDDLYDALVRLHDGLSDEESLRLWSRLTLILMNHIGEREVLLAAMKTARQG